MLHNKINFVQAERLNPEESLMWLSDSPTQIEISGGRNNKTPRLEIGHRDFGSVLSNSGVLQNQESVLNQAALRLGVSLRQTEDELVRNMLASTASQINCQDGNNGDNPTNLSLPDISRMTSLLLSNNGYMFTSSIEGQDKYGTSPVRNAYLALTNTALTPDLNSIQGFISQSNYPSQQYVLESEWGSINNMRFLVSSIGSVSPNASADGASVYNIICAAKEAYACIKQDGASAQFIYRPAYLSGPLAQNVTVGWKMAEVPRILNDAWVGNLRCTLS